MVLDGLRLQFHFPNDRTKTVNDIISTPCLVGLHEVRKEANRKKKGGG